MKNFLFESNLYELHEYFATYEDNAEYSVNMRRCNNVKLIEIPENASKTG